MREHGNHESSSLSRTIRWNSKFSGLGFMACERTTRPIFFSALTFLVLFVLRQKVHKKSLEIPSPATPPLPNPSLQTHPSLRRKNICFINTPGFASLHLGLFVLHPFRVRNSTKSYLKIKSQFTVRSFGHSSIELHSTVYEVRRAKHDLNRPLFAKPVPKSRNRYTGACLPKPECFRVKERPAFRSLGEGTACHQ